MNTNDETGGGMLTDSEIAALFAPLDRAVGLPGRVYSGQVFWNAEREKLFRDDWFAVGYGSDVANPGDVHPVSVAGYELVLVRDKDGQVHVFHNVCRHRGTKLVQKPGNVSNIVCGWHCWTYSLSGSLLATPIISGPRTREHASFDKPALGLIEVRSAVWNDAVFVNLSGKARPFESVVANMDKLFARYRPQDFDLTRPVRHQDRVLKINWKLYHEGGLEGYHLPFVHPALEQPEKYDVHDDPESYTSLTGSVAGYKRIGTLAGQADDSLDFNLAAAAAKEQGRRIPYTICFVTPTLIFAVWPEAIISTMLRPVANTETGVRRNLYFVGAKAAEERTQPARQKYLEIWEGVTAEDADYSEGVQRLSGQREEIGVGTRFSPYWESAVQLFQQRIARRAYGVQAESQTYARAFDE